MKTKERMAQFTCRKCKSVVNELSYGVCIPCEEGMMRATYGSNENERMAQFNQDWARVDDRFTLERLRVFNLIEHYKQGKVPSFSEVAKQSAIPLERAYRHWRSEQ